MKMVELLPLKRYIFALKVCFPMKMRRELCARAKKKSIYVKKVAIGANGNPRSDVI